MRNPLSWQGHDCLPRPYRQRLCSKTWQWIKILMCLNHNVGGLACNTSASATNLDSKERQTSHGFRLQELQELLCLMGLSDCTVDASCASPSISSALSLSQRCLSSFPDDPWMPQPRRPRVLSSSTPCLPRISAPWLAQRCYHTWAGFR